MGHQGFTLVTGTSAQTAGYIAIQTTTATVISSIAGTGITGTWSGTTIPAGITIVGKISSFTLTSGAVIAYFARSTT